MNNESSIQTKIKIGKMFIPLEIAERKNIDDENYIEGAILWTVNGTWVMDERLWDLVDQLWAYLISGLEAVLEDAIYSGTFPDQPAQLRFEPLSGSIVRVTVHDKTVNVKKKDLCQSLSQEAATFFSRMKALVPQHAVAWDEQLDRIRCLSDKIDSLD